MKHASHLKLFIISMAAGLIIYGLIFGLVARRPQSAGIIAQYIEHKFQYAGSLKSPKLALLGASNVRFSHRCETMTRVLGYPCVNLGINNQVALDVMLNTFGPTLMAGDLVYLPLSYEPYMWSQKHIDGLLSTVYLFQYAPLRLQEYNWHKRFNAFFYYDIPFLFKGLAESVLPRFGIQRMAGKDRTFGLHTLNKQGDETGHTKTQAEPYRQLSVPFAWTPPVPQKFNPESSDSGKLLADFLKRSADKGIIVVGGLPTTQQSAPVAKEVIDKLRGLYESNGQHFIALDNKSAYPRDCFFDTGYHLHEGCQIQHSQKVAEALKPFLTAR